MEKKERAVQHPDRRMPDGSFEPMTVEEQWQQLENWRHLLDIGGKSSTVSEGSLWLLRAGREELEAFNTREGISLDILDKYPHAPPLMMLCVCTLHGLYPPPELLLTILDGWNSYAGGEGVSLEEAFLGKPIQKLGEFKKRERARHRRESRYEQFVKMTNAGVPAIKAAEWIAEWGFGGSTDPDNVLREMRTCAKASREAEK